MLRMDGAAVSWRSMLGRLKAPQMQFLRYAYPIEQERRWGPKSPQGRGPVLGDPDARCAQDDAPLFYEMVVVTGPSEKRVLRLPHFVSVAQDDNFPIEAGPSTPSLREGSLRMTT